MLRPRLPLGRTALIAAIAIFFIQPTPGIADDGGMAHALWQRVAHVLHGFGFSPRASRAAPARPQGTATRRMPRAAIAATSVEMDAPSQAEGPPPTLYLVGLDPGG